MIAYTPETMTIKRYSRFEKSRDLRHLFRIWVPVWYATKHSVKFIEAFNKLFNTQNDTNLEREFYKLLAQNKIMLLQAILMGVQMHLGEKIYLDMQKAGNKPHVIPDAVLGQYITEAYHASGISIEKPEDMMALREEIERLVDKYNEMYPVKEQKQGISIMQLAFSVESLMNVRIDYDKMTLSEFAELKELADLRAKAQQDQVDKAKGNG